jgi:hypothetical protein
MEQRQVLTKMDRCRDIDGAATGVSHGIVPVSPAGMRGRLPSMLVTGTV